MSTPKNRPDSKGLGEQLPLATTQDKSASGAATRTPGGEAQSARKAESSATAPEVPTNPAQTNPAQTSPAQTSPAQASPAQTSPLAAGGAPDSDGWIRILSSSALKEGDVRAVTAGGQALCVVREKGRCSVMADHCPHQGAPLSTGWLQEGQIVCPWHGWAFDAHTGLMGYGSNNPFVSVYPTQERPDGIYVKLTKRPGRNGG